MGIFEELERIDGRGPDAGAAPASSDVRRPAWPWLWPVLTVVGVGLAGLGAVVEQPLLAAGSAAAAGVSGVAAGRLVERGQLAWGRRAASRRR